MVYEWGRAQKMTDMKIT